MRLSVIVAVLGVVAALVGGWLVGRWCLGVVLIAEGGLAVGWALFRDFPARQPKPSVSALEQVFERSRAAS